MATTRKPVRFYTLPYFATSKNTLCIARTRVYCEKKEFSPNYFRRAVRWGVFFCFRPASLPARPPLMSVYHVENDYSLPGRVVKGTMYGYGRFSFSSIIFQAEALCHSPVWGVSFQSPAANSASSPFPTNILLIHKTVISRCPEAHRPYSRLILQDTSHC